MFLAEEVALATAKSVVAFGYRPEFNSDPRSVIRRFLKGAYRALGRDQVYVFAVLERWFTPGQARRVVAYTFSFRGVRVVLNLQDARRCIEVGSQLLGPEICSWQAFRWLVNPCEKRYARQEAARNDKRATRGGLDLKYGALAKRLFRAEVRENSYRPASRPRVAWDVGNPPWSPGDPARKLERFIERTSRARRKKSPVKKK